MEEKNIENTNTENLDTVENKSSKYDFASMNRVYFGANLDNLKERAAELRNLVFSTPSGMQEVDRKEIRTALLKGDRKDLIKFSHAFYSFSGEYKRLVKYFADMLTCDFVLAPRLNPIEEKFAAKEATKIYDYAKNSAIRVTSRDIAFHVVLDGAFYGVERESNGKYWLQQLPPEACRSRFKIGGLYTLEFDMQYLDKLIQQSTQDGLEEEEVLSGYPEEFTDAYEAFKSAGQKDRWYLVKENFRVHMLEDNAYPLLAPVMMEIIELDDYKRIEKVKSGLDIYKLLIQKVPTDPQTGEIALEMQEIVDLHNSFEEKVTNQAVDVVTTPAEVTAIDLVSSQKSDIDQMERALNVVYTAAGTPMMLFNSGAKTGTAIDRSIQVDESLIMPLLGQYKLWYEKRFETITNKNIMTIVFPPVTVYNRKVVSAQYLEFAAQGLPTKLLAGVSTGLMEDEMLGLFELENKVMKLTDKLEALGLATSLKVAQANAENAAKSDSGSSSTGQTEVQNPNITGKGAGRPPIKDDSQLSDEGRRTRQDDKNSKYKGTTRKVMEE